MVGELLAARFRIAVGAHEVVELGGDPVGCCVRLGNGRLVESLASAEARVRFLEASVRLRPALGQPRCLSAVLHEAPVGRGADISRPCRRGLGADALELGEQARVATLGAAFVGFPHALVDLGHLLAQRLDSLTGGAGGVEFLGDGGEGGAGLAQFA